PDEKPEPEREASRPPISIGRIELHRSVVILEGLGSRIRLPLTLQISPQVGSEDTFTLEMQLYPRDQRIALTAKVDIGTKTVLAAIRASNLQLAVFSDYLKQIPSLDMSGSVDITGNADIGFSPFHMKKAGLAGSFSNTRITYHDLQLSTMTDPDGEDRPFRISVSGGNDKWHWSAASIAATAPIPLNIARFDGSLSITGDQMESEGKLWITIDPVVDGSMGPLAIRKPVALPLHFSAAYSEQKNWIFSLSDESPDTQAFAASGLALSLGAFSIVTGRPDISIAGKGNTSSLSAIYHIQIPGIRATGKGTTIDTPLLTIQGTAGMDPTASHGKHATMSLDISDTKIDVNAARLHLPDMSLKGEYTGNSFDDARINGRIAFSRGTLIDRDHRVSLQDITGAIPLTWPLDRQGEKGTLSVGDIRWKDMNLGSLEGILHQEGRKMILRATHHNALFSGLSVDIDGDASIMANDRHLATLTARIGQYRAPSDIDLGSIFPAAAGIVVNGTLDAVVQMYVDDSGITGSLKTELTDALILMADRGLTVEGLNVDLAIPDLTHLRSAPQQHLSIERASFGELHITEGKIDFQIESADSFFIEKSSLKWCEGRLYTHALRIIPGVNDYSLIVYADRLKLSALLQQIGSVKAEGQGTVNGRIPIRITDKTFRFADGFLYSTPGDGGSIRLTETEVLTAGIPENTPQHAQLELAREALKDYDYKWVKLNLETKEDMLHLGMQLDGKPANPLPFVYRKELGSFAKIEAGAKGSIFQGIRLDVNFKVPIDKILRYGENLSTVFDMSR
ncbi:MAG: YdbH domain-containing protein, partial [Desulfobacterales bacterium]